MATLLAIIAAVLLSAAALVLLLPATVLLAECLAAEPSPARRGRRLGVVPAGAPPRVVVVVPAHDEAAVIAPTVTALRAELGPHDRLLVIADNCHDETARLAAQAGATVLERHDPARRGKGNAMAFAVQALRGAPPDVVVFVDADCRLAPGSVTALADAALSSGCPAQARNTVLPPAGAGPLSALSAFAFLVKNVVRASGGQRLGVPCPLMGTGMAFTWPLLARAPLCTDSLTEDLRLGIDLAITGHPARYCPSAEVTSPLPTKGRARNEQRRRWEFGHLTTVRERLARILRVASHRHDRALWRLALDICVPPLSLLALATGSVLGLSLLAGALGGSWLPAGLAAVATACLGVAIGSAWARHGRSTLPLATLLLAPCYVLAKVPMYVGLTRRQPSTWVRTERDAPSP